MVDDDVPDELQKDLAHGPEGGPPWGLGQALAGLVVALIASAVTSQIWVAFEGGSLISTGRLPLGLLIANLIGLWLGLFGSVAYSARRANSNLVVQFGLQIKAWPDIPLGIGTGLLFQLVVIPLLYVPLSGVVPHLARSLSGPARQLTAGARGGLANAVLGGLLIVGAPVVEELFFRGLLLRSLEHRFRRLSGPLWRAAPVAFSALVFGLVHAELLQLLGLVAFGLVLGAIAQRTRRLGPTIVAHATFNAAAFLAITSLR